MMRWRPLMLRALLLIAGLSLSSVSLAVIETYDFENESLRERFANLADELRCPKCQNQNIADSNAPIAADLRKQLHAQLHAGRSDQEIVEYMVDRYGDFVPSLGFFGLFFAFLLRKQETGPDGHGLELSMVERKQLSQ